MNLPQPQHYNYSKLINYIETGVIKIPQFQRKFVWTLEKSSKLLDSIIKGYPIGTFIFWKTKDRLRSIRNLGGIKFPQPPKGDYIQYVLDGQQRLTSIFAILKGLEIKFDDGDTEDYSTVYVNLVAKEDEEIIITDTEGLKDNSYIKLSDLLYGGLTKLASLPQKFHTKLDEYKKRIESYAFPVILVDDAPIDIATEIFTRINVGGKPLSVFEIMVAKTFDQTKNFDLAEKYDELIEKLAPVGYDTIAESTVLQVVSILLKKECSKKVILKLDKKKFINIWDDAIDSIEEAVDYFKSFFRIPVSQLLPYNALIIPFSYYFFHSKRKPTGNKQKYLQDFFWRTVLSERYSYSLESKVAQDVSRIVEILNNKLPSYDYEVSLESGFIYEHGWFSAGRSFIKAILCLYAYHQPKSFIDNSVVNIHNDWLKIANSKNYHHFFPKAYLKKKGWENFDINNILNITIVDDYLNKREIKAKSPLQYMKIFAKKNPVLHRTMNTHLIGLDTFGIWENDYDKFIDKREKKILRELKKRIIVRKK